MLCFLKLWLGQHKQLTEAYLHSYLLLLFLPIWVVNKGGLISEVIFTLFPSHPQKLCKITIRCSKFPLQVEKLRKVPSLISQSNSIYLVYFIKISYFFASKELRMAKGPQNVKKFLSDLAVKLQPLWAVERYRPYITSSFLGERGRGVVIKCQVLITLVRTYLLCLRLKKGRGEGSENDNICLLLVLQLCLHSTLIPIGRYCPTNTIQANPYKSQGSGYPVDCSV